LVLADKLRLPPTAAIVLVSPLIDTFLIDSVSVTNVKFALSSNLHLYQQMLL
jgi:hypothetical protein